MGIIPENAKLTPRPKEIPAWDEQSDAAKRVYRRLMENYSGFLDHTDEQVSRLIAAIEKSGEMDNTLIVLPSRRQWRLGRRRPGRDH